MQAVPPMNAVPMPTAQVPAVRVVVMPSAGQVLIIPINKMEIPQPSTTASDFHAMSYQSSSLGVPRPGKALLLDGQETPTTRKSGHSASRAHASSKGKNKDTLNAWTIMVHRILTKIPVKKFQSPQKPQARQNEKTAQAQVKQPPRSTSGENSSLGTFFSKAEHVFQRVAEKINTNFKKTTTSQETKVESKEAQTSSESVQSTQSGAQGQETQKHPLSTLTPTHAKNEKNEASSSETQPPSADEPLKNDKDVSVEKRQRDEDSHQEKGIRKSKRVEKTEKSSNDKSEPQVREALKLSEQRPLDKIHPEIFFGLNLISDSAKKMAANPRFRSSKLILLADGEAERVILNQLLKLHGRLHQQVFVWTLQANEPIAEAWTFLQRLKMPHITLANLRLGSRDGGWVKIKYFLRRLLVLPGQHQSLIGDLKDTHIDQLPNRDSADIPMGPWIQLLERCGVYIAGPMNLDFLMMQALPRLYNRQDKGLMPFEEACEWLTGALPSYLHDLGVPSLQLRHYCDLFSSEDRASIHRRALLEADSLDLMHHLPELLIRMISRVRRLASSSRL